MKQGEKQLVGSVLVFREGISKEEAYEAIRKIYPLLEYMPAINEFDPYWGDPVWYIP